MLSIIEIKQSYWFCSIWSDWLCGHISASYTQRTRLAGLPESSALHSSSTICHHIDIYQLLDTELLVSISLTLSTVFILVKVNVNENVEVLH